MICRKPITIGALPVGCGQCIPCRINRRRVWAHRIVLEAKEHPNNAFVTLTYNEESLPRNRDGIPTLRPDDLTLWLKRFRFRLGDRKIRYFAVGEYGKDMPGHYGRPHYHAIIFNWAGCVRGRSNGACSCDSCRPIADTWGHGFIYSGEVNLKTAQYVAGYVTKKIGIDDATSRHPCFARMSRSGGIGFAAVSKISEALSTSQADLGMTDVPAALRHGEAFLPLGPTMRRKLRVDLGRSPNVPDAVTHARSIEPELYGMRLAAKHSSESLSKIIARKYAGACDLAEARLKLTKETLK